MDAAWSPFREFRRWKKQLKSSQRLKEAKDREFTRSPDEGQQEVEAEEGELGGGVGLGDEVQKAQVREEGGREELRGHALRVHGGRPRVNRGKHHPP